MHPRTILVVPLTAVGHVNACKGALAPLLQRGHRIVFLLEEALAGSVASLGFEEIHFSLPKNADDQYPGEGAAKVLAEVGAMGRGDSVTKYHNLIEKRLHGKAFMNEFALQNGAIESAISALQPHLIYFDGIFLHPAIHYSGIPWISNMSNMVLYYVNSEQVPPGCSGLPFEGDPAEAATFQKLRYKQFYSSAYNDLFESLGYKRYPNDTLVPASQSLSVYACPEELNYEYIRSRGWFNIEVFNKISSRSGSSLSGLVPETFLAETLGGKFSGKYIYLSLGSMGAIDLNLMNRLIGILAQTKHKIIVSKGPRHLEYPPFPANIWGDRYLNQAAIIAHVHLVITHGGNNTVTETFSAGKSMIVLPLFGDQYDNAQRITETGFGRRFDPYNLDGTTFMKAIDELLADEVLQERLANVARRIGASNRHEELAERIEEMLVDLERVML